MLFVYLVAAYMILVARLFYIQVVRAPHFKQLAIDMTVRHTPLPARRGTIYDRDMNKIAVTVDAYDISANPNLIKDKTGVAKLIAPILGEDEKVVLEKLSLPKGFVYLARRASADIGDKIKKAKIDGISSTITTMRMYPGAELACHVVGFVNVDGKGMEGLEKVYNKELSGKDGYIVEEYDRKGTPIPGTIKERVEPINGKDLVLTIDSTLQHGLEVDLRKTYEDHKAAGACAVIMNPSTGEVLALANMPDFDPNDSGNADPASRRNRALTDLYEPGSTLKTLTACAAVESKAVAPNETWYCHGSTKIGKRTVRCSLHGREFAHGHGVTDMAKMLKYSCNIAAAGIGLRVGKQRLYSFEKAFGLYEKPGSGMSGEVKGWHDSWQDWADIRLANIAFGQGIAVTPLQMARAYCAVANGGLLMRPYVVSAIRSGSGIEKSFPPRISRRVISEATSATVSEMLTGVVSDGTGQSAQVDGYRIGGKTGSAQKAVNGRYVAGKIVASFVGFLPITKPRAVILVAVDEPKGSHFGAVVAAPVFQLSAKRAMWRLKIPPDDPANESTPETDGAAAIPEHHGRGMQTASPERPRLGG